MGVGPTFGLILSDLWFVVGEMGGSGELEESYKLWQSFKGAGVGKWLPGSGVTHSSGVFKVKKVDKK